MKLEFTNLTNFKKYKNKQDERIQIVQTKVISTSPIWKCILEHILKWIHVHNIIYKTNSNGKVFTDVKSICNVGDH